MAENVHIDTSGMRKYREQIRQEVKSNADIAKKDGGYIFCTSHNIQADTSLENIETLMDAYLEFGQV